MLLMVFLERALILNLAGGETSRWQSNIGHRWRGLSELALGPELEPRVLDFGRGPHAEGGVPTLSVVEALDVVVDRSGEFDPGPPAPSVEQLDLQVELLADALVGCPGCGGVDVAIKERPLVRVRDLSLAGRVMHLVWRKRRYRCEECGSSFTEQHDQLPSRQRVTARFRQRLLERLVDGAAHAEVARHTSAQLATSSRGRLLSAPITRGLAGQRWRRGGSRWTRRIIAGAGS